MTNQTVPAEVRSNDGLASRVREARKALRMTQAQLAKACGLERTSVTNIESGHMSLSLKVLYRMSEALKLRPDELLGCAPEARVCCGDWAGCKQACVPRASHWQAEANRMTDRVRELQGLIAHRALQDLREQERRHGAG